MLVARTGYTGEDGFEIFCAPADCRAAVGRASRRRGARRRATHPGPGGPRYAAAQGRHAAVRQRARTETITPYEAGLGRVVRLDKPFLAILTFGQGRAGRTGGRRRGPRRKLAIGLLAGSRRVPPGTATPCCQAPCCPAPGPPGGVVTSGAPSPSLGRPIAMAYVEPEAKRDGTVPAIDVRGTARGPEHKVTALPFYRQRRK